MINARDFDYIEGRLLSPTGPILDAHERLRKIGQPELAERLMRATQEFTDACRAIRRDLTDERNAARAERR